MLSPLFSPTSIRTTLGTFISSYWLVGGYLCLLTGLFWLPELSTFTKVYYSAFAAPALLGLLLVPRTPTELMREPVIVAFLIFAAWLLASLLWSTSDSSASSLAKRPLYIFMLFAGCTLVAIRDQNLLLKALFAAAALASLAAMANVFHHLGSTPNQRMVGYGALRNALLSSHVFGFFLTFWMCFWICRGYDASSRRAWLALLAALPLLVACLATGARTPLAALTVALSWMVLLCGKRSAILLVCLTLVAALSLLVDPQLLLQRGVSFRPQLWGEALSQALDALWLGHGYDSRFVFVIPGHHGPLSDPHNVALAVLLELGVLGLLAWIALHGLALLRCLQLRQLPGFQIASALLVYGIAAGMSEGSSFLARPNESWFIIWIPLSLIAALSISHRAEANR